MSDKKDSIGALWKNKSKGGKEYFSGQIEVNGTKIKIVAFANSFKDAENKPDWKIYESEPRDNQTPTEKPSAELDPNDVPW